MRREMIFVVYLAAVPRDVSSAKTHGLPLICLVRGIGEARDFRGGLMAFCDTGDGAIPPKAAEIIAECKARACSGLALDFEGAVRQDLVDLAAELNSICPREGITLIVNKRYRSENAVTLVSSAQVSGSLRQRLSRYGTDTMLEIERLSQDITLPAPQGRGLTIGRDHLSRLLENRATFFSNELLANYFTYKDTSGATHFVIYDDAASISRKIALASAMGLYGVIMLYSEVKDILGSIL